jgi:hypothetical protein
MTRRRAASAAARRQPAHRATSKGCCNLAFAGSDRRNHPILQQPALMFAVKPPGKAAGLQHALQLVAGGAAPGGRAGCRDDG